MKKFYSILLLAVVGLLSFTANALTITVNIDDPTRVTVQVNYQTQEVVAGDNVFTVSEYASFNFMATSGNFLTSVKKGEQSQTIYSLTSCYTSAYSSDDNTTWTVTTAKAEDARTSTCTVTVDDASLVSCYLSTSNTRVTLQNGENTVKFYSGENPITFSHSTYGSYLYSVEQNGTAVSAQGTTYRVYANDGDKITVTANFPDIDVPVHFSFNEGGEGCVSSVTVDGTTVTDYTNSNFTVKAGSKIRINFNTADYNITTFTVNGTSNYTYSGYYETTITAETTFAFVATKYETFNVTINVDHPEYVNVYKNSYASGTPLTLNEGTNIVSYTTQNTYMCVAAVSGCYLVSVSDGTNEYVGSSSSSCYLRVSEGMTITIQSAAISRDQTFVFYVDDISAAYYTRLAPYSGSNITIESGYNTVDFYSGDNPFGFSASYYPTSGTAYLYRNGEALSPLYGSYQFNVSDNDVIKAFLASEPASYTATFNVSVNTEKISVVKDLITEVESWQNGITDFQGTRINVIPDSGFAVKVTVDDAEITADENGAFTFDLTKDVTVSISATSGVETIGTDAKVDNNVYNLNGVLILENATPEEINSLDKGFYIVNGKKVIR